MIIKVKVNTNSKIESLEKFDDLYIVKFKATREKGKANEKLMKTLAKHFSTNINSIKIVRGHKNTVKQVEIPD